jgi:hypothetical protein
MSGITKILLIEDACDPVEVLREHLGQSVDVPPIGYNRIEEGLQANEEESLRNIEAHLRDVPYKAILMDGDLRLGLEGSSDGAFFVRNLHEGRYGELNSQTPVYNISNHFEIPGCVQQVGKDDYGNYEGLLSFARGLLAE